jgi:hypothetical protein
MGFFKYFAGFFILGMAKDALDEYTSGKGIGYQGEGSGGGSGGGEETDDFTAWLDNQGALNLDGSLNNDVADEILEKRRNPKHGF